MSAPYVIAPRCATPDCAGRNVRTVRLQAPNAEPVTVDLCFTCRGIALDRGYRYEVEREPAQVGAS